MNKISVLPYTRSWKGRDFIAQGIIQLFNVVIKLKIVVFVFTWPAQKIIVGYPRYSTKSNRNIFISNKNW